MQLSGKGTFHLQVEDEDWGEGVDCKSPCKAIQLKDVGFTNSGKVVAITGALGHPLDTHYDFQQFAVGDHEAAHGSHDSVGKGMMNKLND